MSGIFQVQDDSALFTEEAADATPLPTPPVEQPPAPTDVTPAPTDTLTASLETDLDADLNAELDAAFPTTTDETEPPTTDTVEPVDEAGMDAFSKQFEKYTGVPFKEAITSYKEMTAAAEATRAALTDLQQQVVLQQQRLDLQTAWASDPVIQQQVQKGSTLSAAIDSRLTELTKVYQSLPEQRQRAIDAQGSQGIMTLWNVVSKRNNRTVPGIASTLTSAAGNDNLMKLSEIMAMPDHEFKTKGLQLLSSKMFVNDTGI